MIRLRATELAKCCQPAPHRIAKSVAGMAFNFSKITIAPAGRRAEDEMLGNGGAPMPPRPEVAV